MRKRKICLILCFLFLLSIPILAFADNRDTIVYITRTGECYHTGSCSYLSKSKIECTLEDAVANGYRRCSRCHPPIPDFGEDATSTRSVPSSDYEDFLRSLTPSSAPPLTTSTPAPVSDAFPSSSPRIGPYIFISCLVAGLIIWRLIKSDREARKREEEKKKEQEQWLKKQRECFLLYGAQSSFDLCCAPLGCYVSDDGLPAIRQGDERWGAGYTFYVTTNGGLIHTRSCSVVKRYPVRAINAYQAQRFSSCSRCTPARPDLSWYKRYREIKSLKERYNIPEVPDSSPAARSNTGARLIR